MHVKLRFAIFILLALASTAIHAQLWQTHLRLVPDTAFLPCDVDTTMSYPDSVEVFHKANKQPRWQPVPDSLFTNMQSFDDLIIYRPKPMRIKYYPTDYARKRLIDAQNSHETLGFADRIKVQEVSEIRDNLMLDYITKHPEKVDYTWRQVPEPWRQIRDRRKIRRDKSADLRRAAEMMEKTSDSLLVDYSMRLLPTPVPSPWKVEGEENMQFSHLLLANWAKGGESSMSLTSDLRVKAIYTNKKHQWENNGTHKLGITYTSTLGCRVSDDVLDLSSKYGYQAVNKWFYSFQTTFKTQMFRHYAGNDVKKEKIKSTMLSPAYVQFIFGMDFKKTDLSVLLSPYTAIITIVADTADVDPKSFKIPEGKRSNTVNGLSITVNWKKKFSSLITYQTKAEVFYEYFEKKGQKRLDWENILEIQINRFLSTRSIFELRYFDNESEKFQFKENICISFKYKF